MIVCGIIVEYNPFHNGHLYHIRKAKELTNCDVLIAVMSATFMQRGEPALIDKFTRTKYALEAGIDLIIELPTIKAVQSANYFAANALEILNEFKIDYLVFGSENNQLEHLQAAAKISNTPAYQALVKQYVKNGQRYASACNLAFKDYELPYIEQANDILALAYLQEIDKHDYKITPLAIKRTNDYLSNELNNEIVSATAIRNALIMNKDISLTTPMANYLMNNQDKLVYLADFFNLLKYQLNILTIEEIQEIAGFEEGLEYLFKNTINKVSNMSDFINQVSSKRYPQTRIQRLIVYLVCNIKKTNLNLKLDYLRVLGMSIQGQKYLKRIKESTSYKIITSFSQHNSLLLDYEHKITSVYALAKESNYYLYDLEYQQAVLIKESNNNEKENKKSTI
ncbi:nucleotidyltransferase [Erysipelotrichaceae bacterium OttesenSCG-928-M19]|nr:nucleotidyltransferase [Erysipelotrichaceae bacterium OttesenSCG-928-M19]